MNIDKKYQLMLKPTSEFGIYQEVLAKDAKWQYLNFNARLMKQNEVWKGYTGDNEYGIILLSGNYSVTTDKGNWKTVNGRNSVFNGIAHTLYLSRHTEFEITAESELLDIACGWCEADEDHPARFKTPDEAAIEIRGGDNATRQINSLIEPGFGCQRLVSVEVYTPSGNWSSFPAHKHDERILDENGNVKEARLEETYFYKVDKPQGYAIQQIYSQDRSLDEIAVARNNDLVMIPSGYHPVAAGHGYNVYYLNFLTGSDQLLTATDDPDHKWIYDSWSGRDPRIPMVTAN
jgi:5-deoxy-glucuronate isomerase